MAACSGSVFFRYEAQCNFVWQENPISPSSSSSSSVVFKVQSVLRLSVAEGNPVTEFLERKGWRKTRQSSVELPWSTDEGLVIDDDHNLQISETLTLLRVPKGYHRPIIHRLRQESADVLHLVGVAPKLLVHIFEVTHFMLPLIDEQGKAIYPEDGMGYTHTDYGLQTQEEEEEYQAKFVDSLKKKLIAVAGEINEEDEYAYIDNWCWDLIDAIERLAWPVVAKEAIVGDEEERLCPICVETILGPDKASSKMPCCSQEFHWGCISKWTERRKKCPWCRSSLPLVLQSAKGLIRRLHSEHFYCPRRPEFHDRLLILWHLLAERVWWTNRAVHEAGCNCGCHTAHIDMIRA